MNSLEFEEWVIHKVGEEEDLKAVDAFVDAHVVHEAASKGSPSQKRALVRKILCEEVFISSAMLKATDLALAAHAEDPKAKAFFAAMKEAFLETDSTLAATLAAAFDVTPQQVVAEYPPSSKCQAFSTAFTWLLVTQSPATSAMAMRVNFATWRKMCRSILGATRSVIKNPYLEKFATAPEKEDQGEACRHGCHGRHHHPELTHLTLILFFWLQVSMSTFSLCSGRPRKRGVLITRKRYRRSKHCSSQSQSSSTGSSRRPPQNCKIVMKDQLFGFLSATPPPLNRVSPLCPPHCSSIQRTI